MNLKSYLLGPFTRDGVAVALVVALLDQALKLWLLYSFELGKLGRVVILPFFDLVLVWNRGISYGWLSQDTAAGAWMLLGFKVVVVIVLWGWLSQAENRLTAVSLGMIIGGGDRKRDRPAGPRRGGRFRAFAYNYRDIQL